MKEKVKATLGITLAQAKRIAEVAATSRSDIRLLYKDKGANAKSLMGIISLAYKSGSEIVICAEGRDAATAIGKLRDII